MNFITVFSGKYGAFCETVKPMAQKANIETGAVLLLLCLCENCDITEILKEQYLMQLFTVGFAELKEGKICVTGKGAIFAKSISIALQKAAI